jgi:hypothetical protein
MPVTIRVSTAKPEIMTWDEYNREFDRAVVDVQKQQGQTMVYLGNDALSLLKQRVQEEGKDAKGKQFDPYSTTPTLTNCSAMNTSACSRIAGSKTKRRELSWVTLERGGKMVKLFELPGGYKQFKELHGRQTGHVDFTFTGRMWNNIGIVSNAGDHNAGTVIIGAKTEEDKKKLEGNTKRKGEILDLSQSEIDTLKERFNLKVLQVFKEHNL